MKHCPNPACSHARAVGSAAEYIDDRATCSDCGAALEDGPAAERPASSAPIPASLWGRLAITAAALPALLLLHRVTLPGVDDSAIADKAREFGRTGAFMANISVVALGIMPLVSAAVLVQVAALIVPGWRSLRWSPAGRARLYKAVLATTLVVCIAQAFSVARLLEDMAIAGDGMRLLTMLTLVAGTFLLIGMASLLSKHGLVNGIAALLFAASAPPALMEIAEKLLADDGRTPAQRLLVVGLPAMFAGATVYTLTLHRRARGVRAKEADAEGAHGYREIKDRALSLVIRAPSSGIIPITFVASLLALFGTLSSINVPMAAYLHASLLRLGDAVQIPLTVGVAGLFAFLFHPLSTLVERWSRGLRRRDDRERVREELQRERRRAALMSAVFVGVLMLVNALSGPFTASSASPLVMGILTAIAMDFVAEWRARRSYGELASIWAEDDVGAADAVMSALAAEAIPVHARGINLRVLLQIMGPYVPIELMVPAARATDATALLRKRFPESSDGPEAATSPRRRKARRQRSESPENRSDT